MANTVIRGVNHPAILKFAEDNFEYLAGTGCFKPETTRCVAMLGKNAEIISVLALDNWTAHQVEATIATDGTKRWASKEFIQVSYDYVFNYCNINRMTMVTAISNTAAINMHKALGHHNEGTLRDWFGVDKPAYIYGFTKKDWEQSKFNPASRKKGEQHGKELTSSTTTT